MSNPLSPRELSPRIRKALAELEFDLWEAIMEHELPVNVDLNLGFTVKREGVGTGPYEESVDVTISIRKTDATN